MSNFNAYLGISLGTLFTMMGTSISTIKSASLISHELVSYIPIVMSGVLAIYGLIVSLLSIVKLGEHPDNVDVSDAIMAASLVVGFSNLFSGIAMGYISDKAVLHSSGINRGLVCALVLAESWGLYGLVTGLVIIGRI